MKNALCRLARSMSSHLLSFLPRDLSALRLRNSCSEDRGHGECCAPLFDARSLLIEYLHDQIKFEILTCIFRSIDENPRLDKALRLDTKMTGNISAAG